MNIKFYNLRLFRFWSLLLIPILLTAYGCKDKQDITEQGFISKHDIVYHSFKDNNWEIYLNSLSSGTAKNITSWKYEDSDNSWSPDGRYIAFHRFLSVGGSPTAIYLYDLNEERTIELTSPNEYDAIRPIWSPDGTRILFQYHKISENPCTYIINRDGSQKRKLFDNSIFKIFFYPNDNDILLIPDDYTITWEKLYKSNLNGTSYDLILETKDIAKDYATIFDFNPESNKLLILASDDPMKPNFIGEYDINTKKLDTLITPSKGFMVTIPKYAHLSRDIVYQEYNNENQKKLCLYMSESRTSKVLFELNSLKESFYWVPPVFSPRDNYIAFVKTVNEGSTWVWFRFYLYVADLNTNSIWLIDEAKDPVWNPKMSY